MSGGSKNKVEYKVQLLDDSTISCRVEKGAKGEELINQVFTFLELDERDYFGLCYLHAKQQALSCWLQSKKPIHKQLGTSQGGYQFRFRVKFYPPDPSKALQKEMTRYSFVCQLKKDIAEERLLCSASTECLLAAYALQAEMGDYDSEEHVQPGYIQQCIWFADIAPAVEERIIEAHKSLRGQSPSEADTQFLQIARKLDLYGITQFEAMDKTGSAISVAAVWNGILVFKCGTRQNIFFWSKVYKLDFKGRHFYVIFRTNSEGSGREQVSFKFGNKQTCKLFWRRCVEYHAFFRLKRREHARPAENKSLPLTTPTSNLERGSSRIPGRSTISGTTPSVGKAFSDFGGPTQNNNHSTPRSKEAEDLPYDREEDGRVRGGPVPDGRGYSTLPHNYRKQVSDTLSSKFDSSIISVDSGSYNLGASQDVLSEMQSGQATPHELFNPSNESQSKEEFVALFQQISQELNKEGEGILSSDGGLLSPGGGLLSPGGGLLSSDGGGLLGMRDTSPPLPPIRDTSSPPHINGGSPTFSNNGTPSLTKVSSVPSMPSRTSSRGSLSSELDELETPITVPLDLLLDVGKSIPDKGFANYLSRFTKSGYSRLHAVSQEFVYTEKTYVKFLGVLNTFLREITIPNGPFNNSQMLLLSNLYEMHQKFLRQLEDRLAAWTNESRSLNIADVLARNLCLFTLYTEYINDYNVTMERFNCSLQEETVFAKHVVMFEGRASSVVSIPNLLLFPVLRIKQYQELTDRLIGCVGEADPSYPDFNEVFHELNTNTPPLAKELPKIMNFTVLQSLETELLGIKEIPVLGRVFLRRGVVRHVTNRSVIRTLVLLSDCLLYCRPKEKKLVVLHMYHVKDMEVEEVRDDNVFSFVVTFTDSHQTLEFHVDDPQDSERWVHDLKFTTSIYRRRRKPETLPVLTSVGVDRTVQELCMVCGITLGRDKRHRTCRLCNKVLCTRCSSWKIPLPGYTDAQRVCESCFSRGDVRSREPDGPSYMVQPPLISFGGDDMLSMEQLSGYVYVRSQNRVQWRRRWIELLFSKLFFYESEEDMKPLGTLDLLHLQVADTKYEDHVSANYAFKISCKSFSIVVATETAYSLKRWLQVLQKATLTENSEMY